MTGSQINLLTKSEREHHVQKKKKGCITGQISLRTEKSLDVIATGDLGKVTRREEAHR